MSAMAAFDDLTSGESIWSLMARITLEHYRLGLSTETEALEHLETLLPQWRAEVDLCRHDGETTTRTAHGYLGDAPAGTVERLCAQCGALLDTWAVTP